MELQSITFVEFLLHQGSFAEMDLHEIRCVLHGNGDAHTAHGSLNRAGYKNIQLWYLSFSSQRNSAGIYPI